jgi:hypothetical protein
MKFRKKPVVIEAIQTYEPVDAVNSVGVTAAPDAPLCRDAVDGNPDCALVAGHLNNGTPHLSQSIGADGITEFKAVEDAARALSQQREQGDFIDVVFDGPPSHDSGRFVEVENTQGGSIRVGEWIDRGNGLWALRIPRDTSGLGYRASRAETGITKRDECEHCHWVTQVRQFGTIAMSNDQNAQPRCEEASPLSRETYIPCGKIATRIIKTSDPKPYRMCDGCADHNVTNRGAQDLGPVSKGTPPADAVVDLTDDAIMEMSLAFQGDYNPHTGDHDGTMRYSYRRGAKDARGILTARIAELRIENARLRVDLARAKMDTSPEGDRERRRIMAELALKPCPTNTESDK